MYFSQRSSYDTDFSSENREEEDNNSPKDLSSELEYGSLIKEDISTEFKGDNNNIFIHDTKNEDFNNNPKNIIIPKPIPLIGKKDEKNNKIKFVTEINGKRKRGQISKNPKKTERTHNNTDFDNLHRKIQVHFLSFVIKVSNDALLTEFPNYKNNFKDISHDIKKIVNYETCNNLKSFKIKDILCQKISSKYSKFNQYINIKILNEVCQSPWLNKFYNMKFMDIFEIYHSNGKALKEFEFEHKTIKLSKSTKTFFNLLNKEQNIPIKNKLNETLSIVYYNGYDKYIKSNSFKSRKDLDE